MMEHCPHADNAVRCSDGQQSLSRRRQRPVLVFANIQKSVSSHSARQQHLRSLRTFCSQASSAQAGSPSGPAVRASTADASIDKTKDLGLSVTSSDVCRTSAPILSGAGGGIFFWWQLGVTSYLALLEMLLLVSIAQSGFATHPSCCCREGSMGCFSAYVSHACPLLQVQ